MSQPRYIILGKQLPAGCPVGKTFINDSFKNKEIYNKLIVARAMLFNVFPFWGHLAMSIPFVEDNTGYIGTMGTDAKNIYYDPTFCALYPPIELMFVVAHEIYHIISNHVGIKGRRGQRIPLLWNYAGDFYINSELIEMQCGRPPTGFPLCYDQKYNGWTTEAIYADLVSNPEFSKAFGSFDVHLEPNPDWDGTTEEGHALDKAIREEWTANVYRAEAARAIAEQAGMGGNELSAGIRRLLADLHAPKHDWRALLRMYIQFVMRKGYSYVRPNKTLFQNGMTIPGFRSKTADYDLAVFIDTSASISIETLTKIISEIMFMTRSFPSFKLLLATFDSVVHEGSVTKLDKRSKSGFAGLTPFLKKMEGGGGTVFENVFEYLKGHRIKPKALLIATDGYPNHTWGDSNYCPTMFLIVQDPDTQAPTPRAPFGRTVVYEESTL